MAQVKPLPFEHLLWTGRAIPAYGNPRTPQESKQLEGLQQLRFIELLTDTTNSNLRLRSDLTVAVAPCGAIRAFYRSDRQTIVLCLEFIEDVWQLLEKDPRFGSGVEVKAKYLVGALISVYLHELGHALIHVNSLPITGREEDVADQFSVWFALKFFDVRQQPIVTPAVWLFQTWAKQREIGSVSIEGRSHLFAGEHSLHEQRVFNLACWALGALPELGLRTADIANLPNSRRERCPNEWQRLDYAMKSIVGKYLKPSAR